MKFYLAILLAAFLFTGCKKDKEETTDTPIETVTEKPAALAFDTKVYSKKTAIPGPEPRTYVDITVPEATGMPVADDSINNKVFRTVRSIVYFGEKPTDAKGYDELMTSFIQSYEELAKKFPKDAMSWEAKVKGTIDYKTDSIIGVKLHHYTFTGGAHGYEGDRSLLFNAKTGRSLQYADIFKDEKAFTAFAEKKFRAKFKIPMGKNINATGLMFENDAFALPQNMFFKQDGLLLFYNAYEVAAYAEQQKELFIPYSEADAFLKMK